MKSTIKKLGIAFSALLIGVPSVASAQQMSSLTEAVLKNYAEILQENPKDYLTLYDRASQYFDIGEFDRALSDIDLALEYTPEKEKGYRAAEYSLKSDICSALKKYPEAIEASKYALRIDPSSQQDLYKLGNLYLLTNQGEEALKIFSQLQRENARSQEAFYGMAKANVMLGRNNEAVNLISQVENLGKQSFVTYCRIGDLYADMGRTGDAVKNYLIAYTMTDDNNRPMESMKFLARKNPQAVIAALDESIAASSDNRAQNLAKAIVAFDSGQYAEVEKACKALLASVSGQEAAPVYRMMALSQLYLDRVEDAQASINEAERLAPSNSGLLLEKAEINLTKDPKVALACAEKVLTGQPDNQWALVLAAEAAMLLKENEKALEYLNSLILTNPADARSLLLRGYLNTELLNDGKAGVNDYTRAGNIRQTGRVDELVYAALGKAKIGKKLDCEGMIREAVVKAGDNKDDLYLIAVYYAQTGNLEKAKEFADKAVANGYNNLYNLRTNNEPLFNLAPIRHLMK